jgi:hypothetical protein
LLTRELSIYHAKIEGPHSFLINDHALLFNKLDQVYLVDHTAASY